MDQNILEQMRSSVTLSRKFLLAIPTAIGGEVNAARRRHLSAEGAVTQYTSYSLALKAAGSSHEKASRVEGKYKRAGGGGEMWRAKVKGGWGESGYSRESFCSASMIHRIRFRCLLHHYTAFPAFAPH